MHVVELFIQKNHTSASAADGGVRASGSQHPSAPLRSVLASPFDRWGSVLHRGTDAMEHAPPAPRRRTSASVIAVGPRRAGRWKVGPSRAARGDRTAGTGRVRGAAARGPSLLPSRGGCLSRCLKPVHTSAPSFNRDPFAAFAGSILHFVFRSFGPGVRYKGVGVYSRLMPAPRAPASACTMVRLRSHDICSRLVASCGLLGVHAHGEAREHTFHASLVTRAS